MAIVGQPGDINFLSPLGFKFSLTKSPNVEYYVQNLDFPRISLSEQSRIKTPFGTLATTADHMVFDSFTITFKIDEDMYNYFEIYDWITAIGRPESGEKYGTLKKQPLGFGASVDADLIVLNGTMNPNIKITFFDVSPLSLSGFRFDSTETDVNYITASAEFMYREYVYTRL